MTGGGSGELAFVKEDSFKTEPGTPTYYQPGRNIQVGDISIENALSRLDVPGSAESVESLAGNFEGAAAVSFIPSSDRIGDVHDIIFNGGSAQSFDGSNRAATSSWYFGVDYLDGVAERNAQGTIVTGWDINWSQDSPPRYSLTMAFADESSDTSITPSSINDVAQGETIASHGADFSLDANTQEKLQSATVSVDNIATLQSGTPRKPVDAVLANPTTSLDMESIITEDDQLALAYGGTGATSIQDRIDGVDATVAFDVEGTTAATYNLAATKPNNYTWNEIINNEANTTEQYSLHVNGITVA
jgi:hypothetical protein